MFCNKKGLTVLVGNFLILLLAIIFVSALALALVPLVRHSFSGVQNCLEAQYGLSFVRESRFMCFDGDESLAGIVVKAEKAGIKKFRLALTDSTGGVTVFDVADGDNPAGFGMFGRGVPEAAGSQQVQLPGEGQQLTYIASGVDIVRAQISPIAKKTVCAVDDAVELNYCESNINLAWIPAQEIKIFITVR